VMTVLARTPHHETHAARANKLSRSGSLVDRNIRRHTSDIWIHFRAGR